MKRFITYILILNMCFFIGIRSTSYAISGKVDPIKDVSNVSIEEGYCKDIPTMSWSNILNGSYLFLGGAYALGSMTCRYSCLGV